MDLRRILVVVSVVTFYTVLSVSVTLLNKASFPRDTFPYPFTVTCFQMIVALWWLAILSIVQRFGPPSLLQPLGISSSPLLQWDLKSITASAGVAGAFMGMLSTGNVCLMFVQVSFYQAAKSQHILCSIALSYFWLRESQNPKILVACMGVTVGFIINTMAEIKIIGDLNLDIVNLLIGCLAGLISSFFVALYPILLKRSMLGGLSTWQTSININAMSVVWYLPAIAYEAARGGMLSAAALTDPRFWLFNAAAATAGFALNIAAMLQVKYTSPLTHMIVGSLKGAVTSLLGVAIYGDAMTPTSAAGLSMLLASTLAYSILKSRAGPPRPAPPPPAGHAKAQ